MSNVDGEDHVVEQIALVVHMLANDRMSPLSSRKVSKAFRFQS